MSAFRFAISLADWAFSVSSSRFRQDTRSGIIPDVQSANALADQAMQAVTMMAAPAFLIIRSSCFRSTDGGARSLALLRRLALQIWVHSAAMPVAWIIRPHFSIDVFSNVAVSARA